MAEWLVTGDATITTAFKFTGQQRQRLGRRMGHKKQSHLRSISVSNHGKVRKDNKMSLTLVQCLCRELILPQNGEYQHISQPPDTNHYYHQCFYTPAIPRH